MKFLQNLSKEQKRDLLAIGVYALFFIALVLIGRLGLKQPVVAVAIILLLETGIAVCLHNVELWIHGAVILVELIVAVLIPRVGIMILAVVLYAVTILALQVMQVAAKRAK